MVAGVALLVLAQELANRPLVTGTPPELRGPMADGRTFEGLSTLGRPALIYFWASWCQVCRAMQGTLAELARHVPLITVALQSGDATEVRRYLASQGLDLPAVVDPDGAIGRAYGVRGVPAVFVLGRDGAIHSATLGYSTAWGLRLRLWWAGWSGN
ncbi:Thiol-disulfide isomerase or thioredoxin [Candidatus Methylocalor cossyra]|uniref:Thiol-disulfide isomerase or thioredoxin n=2 Tax=Candidatus Methylocalor cossyra TaxID=3108543 RepID=A0ABP1C871_9GAMM